MFATRLRSSWVTRCILSLGAVHWLQYQDQVNALYTQRPHCHSPIVLPTISRKAFVDSLSAFLLVTSMPSASFAETDTNSQQFATSAGRKGCVTQSDPSRTIVTCTGELFHGDPNDSINSRLSGVAATENGVGTSAIKNPSRYSPPWTYLTETSDATVAWKSLQRAIVEAGATLELVTDRYIHATAPTVSPPGLTSVDDLEFLLRPDDRVVLYRSVSRSAIFVYPLTQPVSDQNSNLKRLEKIRNNLGWDLLQ